MIWSVGRGRKRRRMIEKIGKGKGRYLGKRSGFGRRRERSEGKKEGEIEECEMRQSGRKEQVKTE